MDLEWANKTNIVLTSKINEPKTMAHFKHKSLCNIVYRVMDKAIANRLMKVIHCCIGECQSVFVSERLITDNVLVAYEIINALNAKTNDKKGMVVIKLDMAYNKVKWPFLKAVMKKMRFDGK